MFPVLFTLGNFPISTFGVLLGLGIFFAGFSVWRIARSYDFDGEKVLDTIFITVISGFIFGRAVFVLENLSAFNLVFKIISITRFPGLSFWGGFLGGFIALRILSKRFKFSFWQAGDFALVGFFIGAFFASLGCFFGGCGYGIETKLIIGVSQVGVIGKRLPIQLFESLIFLLTFSRFWKAILKFYVQGSFLSKGLIILGLTKLTASFFKVGIQTLKIGSFNLNLDLVFSGIVLIIGIRLHYQIYKKTPLQDLASFLSFFSTPNKQRLMLTKISKGWYNQKVNFGIRLQKGRKKLFKLLNIKSNPGNF